MPGDDRPLRRTELPADVADALRGLPPAGEAPETLADAVDALDRLWADGGAAVGVRQLFRPDGTRHVVDFGDRTEFVPCVLDAVIAALVEDDPVEIRSTEPRGDATVRLVVADDGLSVDPPSAVFSLGVDAAGLGDDLSVSEGTDSAVAAACPYINAFQDPAAYEAWRRRLADVHAMRVDAETLRAVAAVAAGEWVTAGPA